MNFEQSYFRQLVSETIDRVSHLWIRRSAVVDQTPALDIRRLVKSIPTDSPLADIHRLDHFLLPLSVSNLRRIDDARSDLQHFLLLHIDVQLFEVGVPFEVTRPHDVHDFLVPLLWLDDRFAGRARALVRI